MRRVTHDDGAVAVVVALLAVVLFGFGALVVDVGALYDEKSQLQSGADAAAFAVAKDCSAGSCGSFTATSQTYADDNSADGTSAVQDVCGTGPGLSPCTDPPTSFPGTGYVRVTLSTRQKDGTTVVPPYLARAIAPGYTGKTVTASATVAWGAAGSVDAQLAITFSQCEYDRLTKDASGNTIYATPPYDPALLRTIYFHDTAPTCPAGPSGADLPGGFGWLDTAGNCQATVTDGWVGDSTGSAASKDCKAALDNLLNKTLLIPVFDQTNGLTGTNGEYQIWSYVGFVLTGYRFPGASYPTGSNAPCASSQTCIQGYFVQAPASGTSIGTGPDQGVRVTQLIS